MAPDASQWSGGAAAERFGVVIGEACDDDFDNDNGSDSDNDRDNDNDNDRDNDQYSDNESDQGCRTGYLGRRSAG